MNSTLTAISHSTLSYAAKGQVTLSTKLKAGISEVPNACSGTCADFKMCISETPRNTEVIAEKMTPQTAGCDPTGN